MTLIQAACRVIEIRPTCVDDQVRMWCEDDHDDDAIQTRSCAPLPELVVLLEVEHELPGFAQVVLLL